MLRLTYVLGGCAILAAGGISALSFNQWLPDESDRLRDYPGVVEAFRQRQGEQAVGDAGQAASPLVAQAEAFAAYLNPPSRAETQGDSLPVLKLETDDSIPATPVRPKEISVDFRVVAVSCYPDRPERSMALICASANPESEAKWVKEGAGIGHFVVHEIKQGAVVLRSGEQQCELAVPQRTRRLALIVSSIVTARRAGDAAGSTR